MALLDKILKPSLFKPKWQHKNVDVRKKALASVSDEKTLVQIVHQDSDTGVRLLALSKIQSAQFLAEFLVSDNNDVRKQAQQQQLDKLLPNQSPEDLNAIDNDHDLVSIASYTQNEHIRLGAINKLSDESIRLDIACNNPVAKVRLAAAQGIKQSGALSELMQIAQGKDKALYRFCKEQLNASKAAENAANALQASIAGYITSAEQLARSAYSPEYNGRLQLLKQNWSALNNQTAEQSAQFETALAEAESILGQHIAEEQAAKDKFNAIAEAKASFANALVQLKSLEYSDNIADVLNALQQSWHDAKQVTKPETEQNKSYESNLQSWLALEGTRGQLTEQEIVLKELIQHSQNLEKASLSKSQNLQKELTQWIKRLPWKTSAIQADITPPALLVELDQALQTVIKHNQNLTAQEADSSKQLATLLVELENHIGEGHLKAANKSHQQALQALKKISHQEAKKYQRHFQQLTAQLTEIRDWQGYAATPKKEALCNNMEALIGSTIDPALLAEKIQNLQEEWKVIGPIARQDDKALWTRFRAAADKAYEPCKAYYAEMANQRQRNLENRQALVAQLIDYEASMDWENADWGIVQKTLDAARETFRSFSPVDRHEHKNSQAGLQDISDKIYAHIKAEYQRNIEAKEALINQATELQHIEELSQAIEQSKQLQAQWKTIGMTPNKADQKLWQAFRLACDAVFARRDEQRQQNKADIEASIEQGEAIAVKAEAIVASMSGEIKAELKEDLQQCLNDFAQLSLPKAVYAKLRKRLADAQQQQEDSISQAKVAKKQQTWVTLADKLTAISLRTDDNTKAEALFQPDVTDYKLPQGIEKSLLIEKWQDEIGEVSQTDLLRDACIGLEIIAQLESPAADQQARMALQVKRLAQGLGQAGNMQQQINESISQWLSLTADSSWQIRYNKALMSASKLV